MKKKIKSAMDTIKIVALYPIIKLEIKVLNHFINKSVKSGNEPDKELVELADSAIYWVKTVNRMRKISKSNYSKCEENFHYYKLITELRDIPMYEEILNGR